VLQIVTARRKKKLTSVFLH